MDSIANIDKAVASVCTEGDKKSDAMMMMAPDSNWDQFLTPAPCAIALLGDLILISADTDFSLAEKPPKDGFKVLRYPNSFRASLVQVTYAGWKAFNMAQTSMDKICLHSGNVDDHVKNAVQFLMKGTPIEIEKILPLSLSEIKDIADESSELAKGIEDQFIGVMELTGELLEACTNTKGVYEDKHRETEIAIKVAKTEKESREKEQEITEKRKKAMDTEVSEAQADFKDAIYNVPSGAALIVTAACEAMIEGVRNITSFTGNLKQVFKKRPLVQLATDDDEERDDAFFDKELSIQSVYKQVSTISKYISQLAEITICEFDAKKKPELNMQRIYLGELVVIHKFIDIAQKHVNNEENSGKLRYTVSKLCDETKEVCNSLEPLAKSMAELENKDDIIEKAVNTTKRLLNQSQKLEVAAKKALGRNPLDTKSPYLSRMPTQSASSSVVKAATENARYKTELAKETLRDAKRRQEKSFEELQVSNEKLLKVMTEMDKLELKEVDFNTIRETLVKGIKALAEVREQWGILVRFFQMLSNLIKCCLHSSLTNFVDQVKTGREIKMTNDTLPLSDIFRDVIFEQASKASQVAYVVRTIAATYVQVSNEHLMDRISCLERLIALDPHRDKDQIAIERKKLHKGCKEAQHAILSIVMKQKAEFNAKVEKRIATLQEIEKAMQPIDPKKIKEIQSNVVHGMAELPDEDITQMI